MAARRRSPNSGSIYQRTRDGRWVAAITLDDGTRRAYYAASRAEAQQLLDEALYQHRHGRLITGPAGTLTDYLDSWLEDTVKPRVKAPSYQAYVTRMVPVARHMGKLRLADIKPTHIQHCYAELGKTLGPTTVQLTHSILSMALEQAVEWNYLHRNPAKLVSPPRAKRAEMHTLTAEQAATLIRETKGTDYGALWHVLLGTLVRIGEALALRWDDVDENRVRVMRTMLRKAGGGLDVAEPKTSSSRRPIHLDAGCAEALRQHRTRQIERRLAYAGQWQDLGLVFSRTDGGIMAQEVARNAFVRTLRRLDLPVVRLHDLRHTGATLLLEQGAHPRVVQEMLGHSSIAVTLGTYSHVSQRMHDEAANALGRLLEGSK